MDTSLPFVCQNSSECFNADVPRFQFLLDDPDAAWQGRLWGLCEDCAISFGLNTAETHEKLVARMWRQRGRFVKGKLNVGRQVTFASLGSLFERIFPGMGSAKRRELVLLRIKAVAAAFIADYAAADDMPHSG